ncbi:hypothetical protein B0H16DRAFT_1468190 [Mycena metata]|uniref:Uncharacterized protein n=1 Tax=Mycena metata TaxID=1033252 RepID=A0AAD7I226_9AGAR|nr:hypothetical protein B0H16DRAFT_1468190 [Mycena metata]
MRSSDIIVLKSSFALHTVSPPVPQDIYVSSSPWPLLVLTRVVARCQQVAGAANAEWCVVRDVLLPIYARRARGLIEANTGDVSAKPPLPAHGQTPSTEPPDRCALRARVSSLAHEVPAVRASSAYGVRRWTTCLGWVRGRIVVVVYFVRSRRFAARAVKRSRGRKAGLCARASTLPASSNMAPTQSRSTGSATAKGASSTPGSLLPNTSLSEPNMVNFAPPRYQDLLAFATPRQTSMSWTTCTSTITHVRRNCVQAHTGPIGRVTMYKSLAA